MELSPDDTTFVERYKLLIGCIVPRPIALVSSISPQGQLNLAPFSFFNAIGSNPMLLMFCPANNPDGSDKDSLRNALPMQDGGTGEFVISVASERYQRQMAAAGEALPFGESEFELTGLKPAGSRVVQPPRVAESPAAFECRTEQVIRTNPGAPGGGNIVIGRVVHIFQEDGLINERFHVDADRLAAIGRMGGIEYVRTHDRFAMAPGVAALEQAADG